LRLVTAAIKHARTSQLDIAYEDSGPPDGIPTILMHGFPYDPRAYDEMVPRLAAAGCRTIVPYIRGYGATRFRSAAIPRSGEQACFGNDLKEFIDALALERVVLAGYDWGGRAACVVAALWPERVRGLVSCGGYNIQDIARSGVAADPEQEHRYWYQWYFCTERGRAGLQSRRYELCRLLWKLWSPNWNFDEATYARSAASFDNPDFVDVVIHSYRHRYGYVPGDPAVAAVEQRLAAQPPITVPTIVLHGEHNHVTPRELSEQHAKFFTGPYQRRIVPVVGHNVPQEAPDVMADAVLQLVERTRG
jgi:pimeloyl-ACP methyl ester carboxylesterase